jgi:hypothetical protein
MAQPSPKTRLNYRRNFSTHHRALACITTATAAINYLTPAHATTVTSTWIGSTSSAWTTPSNWTPSASYPNNGNAGITDYAAVIPAVTTPDLSPSVNSNITLDSLTLNSSASLTIQAGNTLQLDSTFANNGTVTVGSPSDTSDSVLSFGSTTTLSGLGTIALNSPLAAVTGAVTLPAGATISGEGAISNNFTNNGTINANMTTTVGFTPGMGTLFLTSGNITNNDIVEATNSGVLLIATTVNQGSAGEITTGGAGLVSLANCTISGGILFGNVTTVSGDSTNLNGLTNVDFLNVPSGSTLTVNASFANQGILHGGGVINGTVNCPNGILFADEAGHTLVVNGAVTGAGVMGVTSGATLRLAPNTGASTISTINITPNGVLDLTNNHLFIDYGSSADPISSVAALLKSGYNHRTWTGPGINSSTAAANSANYGLGYADSADPGNPANLSSGQIEIKYTLLGDANLSGVVDGADFGILAANFNKGVSRWDQGDFNYDNVVDGSDFADLATNFNKGASGADLGPSALNDPALVAFAIANGLMADVPEPACTVVMAIAIAGVLARRRR